MNSTSLQPTSLDDLSEIKATFAISKAGTPKAVVLACFEGAYRHGSAGNPDAAFIGAMCSAAITAWEPHTLIVDLSNLEYVWGNRLEEVFGLSPADQDDEFQLLVVCSARNKEAIRTLINGANTDRSLNDLGWAFESVEDALRSLA
mgnify:CR=1 FL=1